MTTPPSPHRPFYRLGKLAVIGGVAVAFGTGVLWLLLDTFFQRAGDFGPEKHPAQAVTMRIHGALAMAMMMLLGGTLATHVRHYWRKRRSRATGITLTATWTLLILSSYALYYAVGETSRQVAQWMHIGLGLGLPLWLVLHIRQRRAQTGI